MNRGINWDINWKKHALEQEALVKQLQARIAELEAEIAAINKNSSKPPSSDIVNPLNVRERIRNGYDNCTAIIT